MAVKIGEIQANVTTNVKANEEVWMNLRVKYTDKTYEVSFKPSAELKVGDKVKVTIEKI